MATVSAEVRSGGSVDAGQLRLGTTLMTAAAIGFIGYAAIFFTMNFSDSFLELGIGPNEVNVGRAEIESLVGWAVDHCPVADAVRRAVPLSVEIA